MAPLQVELEVRRREDGRAVRRPHVEPEAPRHGHLHQIVPRQALALRQQGPAVALAQIAADGHELPVRLLRFPPIGVLQALGCHHITILASRAWPRTRAITSRIDPRTASSPRLRARTVRNESSALWQ